MKDLTPALTPAFLVWWLVHINSGYAEAKTLCN